MVKYILILFLLIQTGFTYGQKFSFPYLPYCYTKLPYEFYNAPNIKKLKLKSETSISLHDYLNIHGFNKKNKTEYDTNGVQLINYHKDTSTNISGLIIIGSDQVPDSTVNRINDNGLLQEQFLYFQDNYVQKFLFIYDSLKRCNKVSCYYKDTLYSDDFYSYDRFNRLVENKNIYYQGLVKKNKIDTLSFHFAYTNDRIEEIFRTENQNRFTYYRYIYNEKENSLTEYNIHGRKENKERKAYFDSNGKLSILERYLGRYSYKEFFEYDKSDNLINYTRYKLVGGVIYETWNEEKKYNSKNLIVENIETDEWDRLINKIKYIYEFYP